MLSGEKGRPKKASRIFVRPDDKSTTDSRGQEPPLIKMQKAEGGGDQGETDTGIAIIIFQLAEIEYTNLHNKNVLSPMLVAELDTRGSLH